MLEIDRVAYEAEAQYIRQALKTWETAWAREHGGAKPSRDDIKGNDIAKQYTAYNKIRGILSGKIPEKDQSDKQRESRQSKRKPEPIATPSKRRAVAHETPSKTDFVSASASAQQTPSISRKLFSPVVPTSIGPTPQRDGRVLGLFDVLIEQEESARRRQSADATPSRMQGAAAAPARRESADATPRKQTIDVLYHSGGDSDSDDSDTHGGRRMGRTPMSSGRRNLLNHFTAPPRPPSFVGGGGSATTASVLGTTPLKSRNANSLSFPQNQNRDLLATPSKPRAPVEFATPAFLRRQTVVLDENGNNDGGNDENLYNYTSPPSKLRLPRKPLVRGLSSVLASLRKAEDERLDEELDIMHELETDGRPKPKPSGTAADGADDADTLELQQLEEMEALGDVPENVAEEEGGQKLLGGFDDEGLYDSEPEEALDRGQPLRTYKKKGQKRTHRLVHMRPTRTKRATGGEDNGGGGVGGGDGDDADEAVPETQPGDDDPDYEQAAKKANTKTNTKTKTKKPAPEGVVKKAVRKVNELAHANFKRLKIKNTGGKGGPRFNSRFRRRR